MTAAVLADPRMRDRRVEVLRAQGRRRLRVLLALFSLVASIVGAWVVSRSSILDVDLITVQGVAGIDRAEALRAVGASEGLPMIDLKPGDMAEAVEALPWVASAVVRRQWPATLHVEIAPRMPVAAAPTGEGGFVLLDVYGYAISRQSAGATAAAGTPAAPEAGLPADGSSDGSGPLSASAAAGSPGSGGVHGAPDGALPADPLGSADMFRSDEPFLVGDSLRATPAAGLPLISVPFDGELGDVHRDAGPGLSAVAALTLAEDLMPWVDAVTVGSDKEVGLRLVGGAVVILGEPTLLDSKVASLRALLAGIELDCVVSIDVTMADLATVRRHPSCGQAV